MIEAVIERCAGIDVGRKFVVVCVMVGEAQAAPRYEIRKFLSLNNELEQLREWLHETGCTHVVMESTGSYWKPIFHLRHGMIRPSFIPPREIRELRDLTRRRKQLIGNAVDERNRVQRVLQEANVQLGTVQARKKIPQIQAALEGHHLTEHHRGLIQHSMRHLAFLEDEIAELDDEIARKTESASLHPAMELVETIPGIKKTAAAAILAETGNDMTQFPKASKLPSWIGVCPGNNESAGRCKSGQTTKGNPWARRALVECAWSATRKKDSATQELYERLKPRSNADNKSLLCLIRVHRRLSAAKS